MRYTSKSYYDLSSDSLQVRYRSVPAIVPVTVISLVPVLMSLYNKGSFSTIFFFRTVWYGNLIQFNLFYSL